MALWPLRFPTHLPQPRQLARSLSSTVGNRERRRMADFDSELGHSHDPVGRDGGCLHDGAAANGQPVVIGQPDRAAAD